MNKEELDNFHKQTTNNKELLQEAQQGVCIYCKNINDYNNIDEYIDDGQTALCPHCGIDAMMLIQEKETLDELHEYFFRKGLPSE